MVSRYEAPRRCATPTKRPYKNRKVALMAVALRAKVSRQPLQIYKCPGCHAWHLTSKFNLPSERAFAEVPGLMPAGENSFKRVLTARATCPKL